MVLSVVQTQYDDIRYRSSSFMKVLEQEDNMLKTMLKLKITLKDMFVFILLTS